MEVAESAERCGSSRFASLAALPVWRIPNLALESCPATAAVCQTPQATLKTCNLFGVALCDSRPCAHVGIPGVDVMTSQLPLGSYFFCLAPQVWVNLAVNRNSASDSPFTRSNLATFQ